MRIRGEKRGSCLRKLVFERPKFLKRYMGDCARFGLGDSVSSLVRKVMMIVVLAAGVKGCVTNRTLKTTIEILLNGQLCAASTAENGHVVPFALRPKFDRMVGESRVAIFARVKRTAAPHLDGDDVGRTVIVFAPSLRVEIQASHFA